MNQNLSDQSKRTILAYIASGVLSGFLASINFSSVFVLWGPGFVFGISFAITKLKKGWHRFIYTIISGIIYRFAVEIAMNIGNHYIAACFLAGLCGALGLAIITKLFSNLRPNLQDELKTALVGGIAGIAFALVADTFKVTYLSPAIAYVIWQVPVAMLLISSIQKQLVNRPTIVSEAEHQIEIPEQISSTHDVSEQNLADSAEMANLIPTTPLKAKQSSTTEWLFATGTILLVGIIIAYVSSANSRNYSSSYSSSDRPSPTNTPTPAPRIFNFKVNGDVITDIEIAAGDYVWTVANGKVLLGIVVGDVGPDGETAGIWQSYNIDRRFPYGSLLCRIEGQSWQLCGSDSEVRFSKAGRLEFAINDKTIGGEHKNSAWNVQVAVSNYSYKSSIPPTATPSELAEDANRYIHSAYGGCHITSRDLSGGVSVEGFLDITNLSSYPINIFTSDRGNDFDYSSPILVAPGETRRIHTGGYFANEDGPSCAISTKAEWAK